MLRGKFDSNSYNIWQYTVWIQSSFEVQLINLSVPHLFWLWQKWVYQSIQRHTGLIYPFNFVTFGHSGAQSWAPEWPNVTKLNGWIRPVWRWILSIFRCLRSTVITVFIRNFLCVYLDPFGLFVGCPWISVPCYGALEIVMVLLLLLLLLTIWHHWAWKG